MNSIWFAYWDAKSLAPRATPARQKIHPMEFSGARAATIAPTVANASEAATKDRALQPAKSDPSTAVWWPAPSASRTSVPAASATQAPQMRPASPRGCHEPAAILLPSAALGATVQAPSSSSAFEAPPSWSAAPLPATARSRLVWAKVPPSPAEHRVAPSRKRSTARLWPSPGWEISLLGPPRVQRAGALVSFRHTQRRPRCSAPTWRSPSARARVTPSASCSGPGGTPSMPARAPGARCRRCARQSGRQWVDAAADSVALRDGPGLGAGRPAFSLADLPGGLPDRPRRGRGAVPGRAARGLRPGATARSSTPGRCTRRRPCGAS